MALESPLAPEEELFSVSAQDSITCRHTTALATQSTSFTWQTKTFPGKNHDHMT